MKTCNLGDSGYLIVRPGSKGNMEKIFRSTSQQHYFNCPYQCGHKDYYNLPYNAEDNQHEVKHNDIVVMGSDGVFDNLFDEQIMKECIKPQLKDGQLGKPGDAALCVSSLAEALSYMDTHESPWTVEAVKAGKSRSKELGGKEDDITVIVAQIKL